MVTTQRSILNKNNDILLAMHDDNGQWEFITDAEPAVDAAVIVTLDEILRMDDSITSLSDLPRGWRARRISRNHAWERSHD
jgi:hypothetical protein